MSALAIYSWVFIAIYVGFMWYLGFVGMRRTKSEEEYATARQSYGPVVTALTVTATFASGATFMGLAGMSYGMGWSNVWYGLLYPFGGYMAMVFFAKISRSMNRVGARTMAEFLGIRYDSGLLRIMMAILSFLLLYYVTAQFVAAGMIFQGLLGIDYKIALVITAIFTLVYMVTGGAHADALTDSVQGALMVLLGVINLVIFVFAIGVPGGVPGINDAVTKLNPNHSWNIFFNPEAKGLWDGWWVVLMFMVAHIPFSVQPHFGTKFLLLKRVSQMPKMLILAAIFGLIMPLSTVLIGLQGRALLTVNRPDMIVVEFYKALLPAPFVALFLVVILCAIMSTADGLYLGLSQSIANDIFRKTIVPRTKMSLAASERWVKWITRIMIIVITFLGIFFALTPPKYLTVMLWIGIGGIMSAAGAPLFIGAVWQRATKTAAIATFLLGIVSYVFFYQVVKFGPFAATGTSFLVSIGIMIVVSLLTKPLPPEHLKIFGFSPQAGGTPASSSSKTTR